MIFGDTYAPAISLISPVQNSAGAVVSRYPLLQASSQFGKRTFTGSTFPGWEVELYRDGVLLAYQQTRDDGRYEFRDIPLLFGVNRFRLVFYGPHGERREEAQTYNVAQSLTQPHQFDYRLAMTQQDNGGMRASWQQDVGLFNNISWNTVLASLRLADGVHQYLSTGMRGYWRSLFLSSDLASDRHGGVGSSLDAQTQFGPLSLTVNHTQLSRFTSEQYLPSADNLNLSDTLRLDNIPLPRIFHLPPMSLQLQRQSYASHAQHTVLQGQLSGSLLGIPLSNYYNWTEDRSLFLPTASQAYGNLVASRQWHGLGLRGEVAYDVRPVSRVSGLALTTEKVLRNNYTASLLLNRALVGKETSILLSLTRNTGPWSVSHSASVTNQGHWLAGSNAATSLSPDPRTGQWHADARALSNEGSLSLRVFFDANGNGKMDPGEKPLKGVGFLLNGSPVKERTDAKGIVFLQGYTCYSPLAVSIDPTTLEDPLYTPLREGVTVIPRPGSAAQLDLAVVATGEISGTVYRTAHGAPAAGVRLELLDARDKVIQSARTSYDGYYVISKVPCGHYTLRIAPKQAVPADPRQNQLLEIPPEGAFLDGVDIVLAADAPVAK